MHPRDSCQLTRQRSSAALATAIALGVMACKSAPPPPVPIVPKVVVVTLVQRNVPVFPNGSAPPRASFNARIYPRISGYLLKQAYKDGDKVTITGMIFSSGFAIFLVPALFVGVERHRIGNKERGLNLCRAAQPNESHFDT